MFISYNIIRTYVYCIYVFKKILKVIFIEIVYLELKTDV